VALNRLARENLELRRAANAIERTTRLRNALAEIAESIYDSRDTKQMASATAAIVGRVLSADRAGFGYLDDAVEAIDVETDWSVTGVASIVGRHGLDAYGDLRGPITHGEPLVVWDALTDEGARRSQQDAMRIGIRSRVDMPVRQHGKTIAVLFVHSARPRSWSAEVVAFLRGAADRLEAGIFQHRAAQQQSIVNGEIAHRLKNTLSIVQAIASQTLRTVSDREAVFAFERRLIALSAAHDALLDSNWTQTDLRTVASTVIETVGFADRCTLTGPPVALRPRAALTLSLIVHELLTNACKYGALSNAGGEVSLAWRIVEGGGGDDRLEIHWHETGGPLVTEPVRRGFGSKLIGIGLAGSGGVSLSYERCGFSADLQASLTDLARA
jgi:two-component sensor histidine kinase